jgi:hypothetical protein
MRIMALVLASFSGSVFRGYGFSRGQACGGSSKPGGQIVNSRSLLCSVEVMVRVSGQ